MPINRLYKTSYFNIGFQDERPLPSSLKIKTITLSNSDLSFSVGVEPVIEMDVVEKNGITSPSYVPDDNSIEYITVLMTQDLEVSKKIEESVGNISMMERIVYRNSHKIQRIDIPYNQKDVFMSGDKFKFKKIENFKPLSFKEASNPQNLNIYAMFVRENCKTEKKNLLSEVYSQQVISQGSIVLGNLFTSNIVDLRDLKFDEYLNFDIVNQANVRNKAYFSDLFCSPKRQKVFAGMFFWDKIQFLKEKSLYGNVLKLGSIPEARQKIIDDSRITEMKIIRKRVKKNIDGFSLFDKDQKNEVIIYSSEDEYGDFISATSQDRKTGEVKSKLGTTGRVQNALDYVSFSFEDYAPQKINIGTYQYSVEIKLRDGMLQFLLDSLDSLRNFDKNYQQYQNIFYFGSSQREKIEENVNEMLEIMFSMRFFSKEQMQSIKNEFYVLISSFDGFQKVIDFNRQLMTKISYALGKRGITNSGSKIATYSNVLNIFSLQDEQKFQEIIDFSEMGHIKTDYFNIASNNAIGLSKFQDESIKSRFLSEFKKYMKYETVEKYEDINFTEVNQQIYEQNTKQSSDKEMVAGLFDFSENFYTYLSPATQVLYGENVNNNEFEYKNYNPKTLSQYIEEALMLNTRGVKILTKRETAFNKAQNSQQDICSREVLGEEDKANTENTYSNNAELDFTSKEMNYAANVQDSFPAIRGINSFYNNFNLKRQDYDLDNPANLLYKKRNEERKEFYTDAINDMPNQLRAVFGSKSDLVKNKWNLMENDFFANPESSKMMKENFSNLIRVEILSGFELDSSGMPNSKNPIFNKLRKQDFDSLKSGENILCKATVIEDTSMGLGQKDKDSYNTQSYYNQFFIITKE